MLNAEDRARFEQIVLPHLDAAFNLAAWILSSRTDAEEVTQDAMLRAFRFFESFNGGDVRAWLLQIVRNTCYTWLEKNRRMKMTDQFDERLHILDRLHHPSFALHLDVKALSTDDGPTPDLIRRGWKFCTPQPSGSWMKGNIPA